MMHRLAQLLLLVSLFNYSLCNCLEKLKRCDKVFQDEMKAVKWNTADSEYRQIYYDICSREGIYDRFVKCVEPLRGQCDDKPQFRKDICNTRWIKMNTYRYTWRPSLIHDVCYRTLPVFDAEFFKHEKCIAKVLNPQRINCDTVHYKLVKSTNGMQSCPHWDEYRKCSFLAIQNECGVNAANVSDYLFHVHGRYFTKYSICNFTGMPNTECWYDWLLERQQQQQPSTIVQVVNNSSTTPSTVTSTQSAAESIPDFAWSVAPKHGSTYVSTKSNEQYSTVESTEWNKASSTAESSQYEEVVKKESSNDESYFENSIDEEKHSETDHDDDEDDNDHEVEKEVNESESFEAKKKSRKRVHHSRRPVHDYSSPIPHIPDIPTIPDVGINHELFQNDADPKNGTAGDHEASAQQMDKSTVVVRESKALQSNSSPQDSVSTRKATINLASVAQPSENGASALLTGFSSLLSFLLSLLVLSIITV